jgi:ribosomal protein S13
MNIKRLMEIGCYRGHAASVARFRCGSADAHERAHAQGPRKGAIAKKKVI